MNFLSSALTETCMYILSMSEVMDCFGSRSLVITPSRLQSKSCPVRSIPFRQLSLNLDWASETRRSFPGLFGLITPCSGKIHPVEGFSSDSNFLL